MRVRVRVHVLVRVHVRVCSHLSYYSWVTSESHCIHFLICRNVSAPWEGHEGKKPCCSLLQGKLASGTVFSVKSDFQLNESPQLMTELERDVASSDRKLPWLTRCPNEEQLKTKWK